MMSSNTSEGWCSALLKSIGQFRQQGLHCDTQLVAADGTIIAAHTCVLAAASPIINMEILACKAPAASIQTNVPCALLECVLDITYSGKLCEDFHFHSREEIEDAAGQLGIELPPSLFGPEKGNHESTPQNEAQPIVKTESTEESSCDRNAGNEAIKLEEMEDSYRLSSNSHFSDSDMEITVDKYSPVCEDTDEDVKISKNGQKTKTKAALKSCRKPAKDKPDEKPHSCTSCSQSYSSPSNLKRHMRHCHSSDNKVDRPDDNNDKTVEKEGADISAPADSGSTKVTNYACPQCSFKTKTKAAMASHKKVHSHSKVIHICHMCGKRFQFTKELEIHLRSHTGEKPLSCPHCLKTFSCPSNRRRHVKTMHCSTKQQDVSNSESKNRNGRMNNKNCIEDSYDPSSSDQRKSPNKATARKYICIVCGFKAKTFGGLVNHEKVHVGEERAEFQMPGAIPKPKSGNILSSRGQVGKFKCSKCGYRTRNHGGLVAHERGHRTGTTYLTCTDCFKKFKSSSALIIHRRSHGVTLKQVNHQSSETYRPPAGAQKQKCIVCQKVLSSFKRLVMHHRVHHAGIKPFKCQICSAELGCPKNFKIHLRRHQIRESGALPYQCQICGKKFALKESLTLHEHSHIRKYQCSVCSKGFARSRDLKVHSFTHTGERPMICSICGKGYTSRSTLKKHEMRNHDTSETTFQCSQCPKTFRLKENLAQHEKVHKEPKHQCELCGKKFRQLKDLKVHHRRHTGEKPYICSFCSKAFSCPSNFRKHEKWHRDTPWDQQVFQCSYCPRHFPSKSRLDIHECKHTGAKPVECPECGKGFCGLQAMKVHQRVHKPRELQSCKYCGRQFSRADHLSKHEKKHADDEEQASSIHTVQELVLAPVVTFYQQ